MKFIMDFWSPSTAWVRKPNQGGTSVRGSIHHSKTAEEPPLLPTHTFHPCLFKPSPSINIMLIYVVLLSVKFYIFTIMASVYKIKWRLHLVQLPTFGHRERLIVSILI